MAKTNANAADENTGKKGGLMAILSKVFAVTAILCGSALLAGLYDVGHMGLKELIEPLAIVLVGVYFLFSIAGVFMGGKTAPASVDTEGLMAKIEEVQKKNTSNLVGFQHKIDILMGQDYEALLEEKKELQAQLDAIANAEREKADNEMEELRERNKQLEEQMKQWALETVGSAITKPDASAAAPAPEQAQKVA